MDGSYFLLWYKIKIVPPTWYMDKNNVKSSCEILPLKLCCSLLKLITSDKLVLKATRHLSSVLNEVTTNLIIIF